MQLKNAEIEIRFDHSYDKKWNYFCHFTKNIWIYQKTIKIDLAMTFKVPSRKHLIPALLKNINRPHPKMVKVWFLFRCLKIISKRGNFIWMSARTIHLDFPIRQFPAATFV